jgi:Zn-dependent peptidase ImmA (M78 family)
MPSVIASLRSLVPNRPLTYEESLRVAERQAGKLLELAQVTEPPVPEGVVASLPRVQVQRLSPIPVSGSTHWAKSQWLIVVNGAEPATRQRYSMLHEFKHVLDNPFIDRLYPATPGMTSHARVEQVCDVFAAYVLMPKVWVRRAWATDRIQDLAKLARMFGVSHAAMRVRLLQLGLMDAPARCRGPQWTKVTKRRPGTYYREVSMAA